MSQSPSSVSERTSEKLTRCRHLCVGASRSRSSRRRQAHHSSSRRSCPASPSRRHSVRRTRRRSKSTRRNPLVSVLPACSHSVLYHHSTPLFLTRTPRRPRLRASAPYLCRYLSPLLSLFPFPKDSSLAGSTISMVPRRRRLSSPSRVGMISASSYVLPAALRNGNCDHRFWSSFRQGPRHRELRRSAPVLTTLLREIGSSTRLESRAETPRTSRARTHVRRPVLRSGGQSFALICSSTPSPAGLTSCTIRACRTRYLH